MHSYEIWWSAAIMIATAEIFFGALYFASAGFALFCAGVAARFGAGLPLQLAVAAGVGAAAFALLRWRGRRRAADKTQA